VDLEKLVLSGLGNGAFIQNCDCSIAIELQSCIQRNYPRHVKYLTNTLVGIETNFIFKLGDRNQLRLPNVYKQTRLD
jgi:hypothetical protein